MRQIQSRKHLPKGKNLSWEERIQIETLQREGKDEIGAHDLESPLTSKDIRYTTKGDTLYAIVMDWPKAKNKPVVLTNISAMNHHRSGLHRAARRL